jgi:hypothetical protein
MADDDGAGGKQTQQIIVVIFALLRLALDGIYRFIEVSKGLGRTQNRLALWLIVAFCANIVGLQ